MSGAARIVPGAMLAMAMLVAPATTRGSNRCPPSA